MSGQQFGDSAVWPSKWRSGRLRSASVARGACSHARAHASGDGSWRLSGDRMAVAPTASLRRALLSFSAALGDHGLRPQLLSYRHARISHPDNPFVLWVASGGRHGSRPVRRVGSKDPGCNGCRRGCAGAAWFGSSPRNPLVTDRSRDTSAAVTFDWSLRCCCPID